MVLLLDQVLEGLMKEVQLIEIRFQEIETYKGTGSTFLLIGVVELVVRITG